MHTFFKRPWPQLLAVASGLATAGPVAAQEWTGLALSNYAGTNGLYINPASLADSRHKFYLNMAGAGVNFSNTYLQLDLPAPASEYISGSQEFKIDYLNEQPGSGPKAASIAGEARLPGFMFSLGKNGGMALTNRVRTFVQASDVSESLARLGRYGLDEAEKLGLGDKLLNDNSFNLSTGAYHEFALSYARTLTPSQEHFWKVGGTVKYLVGLGGGYLRNEGTGYQVYDGDSIQLKNPNLNYGFVNTKYYDRPDFTVGSLYGSQRLGRGFGFDLGVTYEWRPEYDKYDYQMDGKQWADPSRNKYRLRVGLALTDVGAVSYNNERYVQQAQLANNRTIQIGQIDTVKINSVDDLRPTLRRLVGLSSESQKFTSALPTTLRLTADYRVANHLFAGLLWTQSLLPATTIGHRTFSSLAVIPRVEFSHLEVAVPVILANSYKKVQLGAMVRLGPVFVGSDNLGGLFSLTSTTGADVYFGVGITLNKSRHKDKDKDGVSNKLDKCPKEKGALATKGCATVVPAPVAEPTAAPAPATTPETTPAAAPTPTTEATPAPVAPAPEVTPAPATPAPAVTPVTETAPAPAPEPTPAKPVVPSGSAAN